MLQVKYARYTPHDAYLRLSNEHYILDVDRRSGVIKGLYLTNDAQGTNFVGNEQNMRLNVWWKHYRNGCFSGEVGMGLYGNLSMLKSYLVQDPDFGLVGYGCTVAETKDDYTLVPQDGLGVRATFVPLGVTLETVKARIEKVMLSKDLRRLELVLSKPSEHAECAHISIRGMPSGSYQCSAGKVKVGEIIAWDVPYVKGQESFNVTLSC